MNQYSVVVPAILVTLSILVGTHQMFNYLNTLNQTTKNNKERDRVNSINWVKRLYLFFLNTLFMIYY